jgi:hypothetical protein
LSFFCSYFCFLCFCLFINQFRETTKVFSSARKRWRPLQNLSVAFVRNLFDNLLSMSWTWSLTKNPITQSASLCLMALLVQIQTSGL